jgi:dipeptidyl aminopeptidase/acylaminoacyl peptidase
MSGSRLRFVLHAAAILLASAAQALAAPIVEGVPPRDLTDPKSLTSQPLPSAAPVPLADLFFTRTGSDAIWIPHSGAVAIGTNLTGRFNLWTMPANGGFPLQLTQSDERQFGLAASPDGKWIVFQADHGGAEIHDLYATPASGGAVVDLTNTPDVDEQSVLFSPVGSLLAFTRRPKTEPSNNIAVMDFATRQVRQLTHEADKDFAWGAMAFSHDGKSILAERYDANGAQVETWLIDIASGRPTRLTPSGKFNSPSDISADGRHVAVTTETASGAHQAALVDVRDGSVRLLKPGPWAQRSNHFSPDGRRLLFTTYLDGRTTFSLYDVASGKTAPVRLPDGFNDTASDQNGFSPDGAHILVAHQASNTPFDFWVVDAKTGAARQLTRFGLASIDPARLPKAQIVHYKSFDGTVISAFVWIPFNLARDGKAPAVVLPHGGPTSQYRERFDPTAVALASRGFVVIAPNVRGSTGYGRAFQEADYRDLGGGDLKDEIAGVHFLVETGYVDEKRVGMTGGSYGGYMTLMALGKAPGLLAAGVSEYGIIDWRAIWLHADLPNRQYLESFLGDPVKDKAAYEAASPLTYLKNATAPLLVLQGDNDARVTKDQAEKVVELMKANGRTVEAHFYPGEGHGFFKREDQIDALERTVAWLEKYLKR